MIKQDRTASRPRTVLYGVSPRATRRRGSVASVLCILAAPALGCASTDDAASSDALTTGMAPANPAPPPVPTQRPMPVGNAVPTSPSAAEQSPVPVAPPAPPEETDELPTPLPTDAKAVPARASTPAVHDYDDAPASPDPDDPAIWIDPGGSGRILVVGTVKEGGLQVYGIDGQLIQSLAPANRPLVSELDPFTPAGVGPISACPDSTTGADVGRYNNVDIEYGFELTDANQSRAVDIAVVSDRGCDRIRIFEIDPTSANTPLIDITARDAPRLFPTRFEQPSPIQSPGVAAHSEDNPLEDQDTAYGLTTFRPDGDEQVNAIVSQNNRSVLAQFELRDAGDGTVTYDRVREFHFPSAFSLASNGSPPVQWSPCREEVGEDLQIEGVVVDEAANSLFAAQEVIGLWQVPLDDDLPDVVVVPEEQLFERTLSFGAAFWAVPNVDGEFDCESTEPAPPLVEGTVVGAGVLGAAGAHLAADAEGLAIYDAGDGSGYLIASSQGDDTFHVYDREQVTEHLGSFRVEGTGATDGHEVTSLPAGPQFPNGVFIMQTGIATPPADTSPVNGFEYDGSGQFVFIGWEDIAEALNLDIADPEDVTGD